MNYARGRLPVIDALRDGRPTGAHWIAIDLGDCDGVYPALVADGYPVHGDDVLARLDRDTVEQIAADLAVLNTDSMPGELAVLCFDGDVLVVLFEHDDGVQTRQRETDRVYPNAAVTTASAPTCGHGPSGATERCCIDCNIRSNPPVRWGST